MGKRNRDETEEERKKRKRAKKEAKKRKKEQRNSDGRDASEVRLEEDIKEPLTAVSSSSTADPVPPPSERETETGTKTKQSPFDRKRVEIVVSLFPVALGNVLDNVRQALRSMLLKYSDGIGGILLAFDKVKLVGGSNGTGGHGVILNEMPHIHYKVSLDALVFCPAKGVTLMGVVNECFPSHVGMLVHSFFNAMVSSDHLQSAGYVFDQDLHQWIMDENCQALGIGDKVEFTVQKLHECAGVISLEGSQPSVVAEQGDS